MPLKAIKKDPSIFYYALAFFCILLLLLEVVGLLGGEAFKIAVLIGFAILAALAPNLQSLTIGKEGVVAALHERIDKQAKNVSDIELLLPLLLPETEVTHIVNLLQKSTSEYKGSGALRKELRRLASVGLVFRKSGIQIHDIKDGETFDLKNYVELTDLGRRLAKRILEIRENEGGLKRPETELPPAKTAVSLEI